MQHLSSHEDLYLLTMLSSDSSNHLFTSRHSPKWPSQLLKFWDASTLLGKDLLPETPKVPSPITIPTSLGSSSGVPSPNFLMVHQIRTQCWHSRILPASCFSKMTSSDSSVPMAPPKVCSLRVGNPWSMVPHQDSIYSVCFIFNFLWGVSSPLTQQIYFTEKKGFICFNKGFMPKTLFVT